MNALVYLKERTRMCDYTYSCTECDFFKHWSNPEEPCNFIEAQFPMVAIEIIDKWSAAHPPKEYNWHKVNKIKRED